MSCCCTKKETISCENAPAAIGPYSVAVSTVSLVFVSGQLGLDKATGSLVAGGIQTQTRKALENMKAILESAGLSMENVVKTTVFLADMNDFAVFNEVYAKYFSDNKPARATVQAARLPRDARVEIECIAVV